MSGIKPTIHTGGEEEIETPPLPIFGYQFRIALNKKHKLLMKVVKWRAKDAKGKRMIHLMPFDSKIEWKNPAKVYASEFREEYELVSAETIRVLYGK